MRCNSSYDSPAVVVCSAARQDNTPPRDSFCAERAALNRYSLKSVGDVRSESVCEVSASEAFSQAPQIQLLQKPAYQEAVCCTSHCSYGQRRQDQRSDGGSEVLWRKQGGRATYELCAREFAHFVSRCIFISFLLLRVVTLDIFFKLTPIDPKTGHSNAWLAGSQRMLALWGSAGAGNRKTSRRKIDIFIQPSAACGDHIVISRFTARQEIYGENHEPTPFAALDPENLHRFKGNL
nr:hypothetical protein CFP56_12124 [Quercus suber]